MNYIAVYFQLCKKGLLRGKNSDEYLERHHIIPTFFFKDNDRNLRYNDGIFDGTSNFESNYSYLTPREHFLAHLLLHKIFWGTKWSYRCNMSVLLFYNNIDNSHTRQNYFNPSDSKKYEYARKAIINNLSALRKGTMIAKVKNTSEKLGWVSTSHPKVLSGEWVHHSYGKPLSDKHKSMISKRHKGEQNGNSVTKVLRENKELIHSIILEVYEQYKDTDKLVSKNTLKTNNFSKRKFECLVAEAVRAKVLPQRKNKPIVALKEIIGHNNYHHVVNNELNLNLKTRYE